MNANIETVIAQATPAEVEEVFERFLRTMAAPRIDNQQRAARLIEIVKDAKTWVACRHPNSQHALRETA